MHKYIVRRVLSIIPVLWLVSIMVFALIHLVPGDPVLVILGSSAQDEQVELMRQRLGLDQNIGIQYWDWTTALLQGDLGTSIISDEPVAKLIAALPGDTVRLSDQALIVNGAEFPASASATTDREGRAMHKFPRGTYIVSPHEAWLISTFNPRSWDSRYYGPIPLENIRSVVRPLLTFPRF